MHIQKLSCQFSNKSLAFHSYEVHHSTLKPSEVEAIFKSGCVYLKRTTPSTMSETVVDCSPMLEPKLLVSYI
jgi:hypothetical protein